MLVPTSDHQEVLFAIQVEFSMYSKIYLGILYLWFCEFSHFFSVRKLYLMHFLFIFVIKASRDNKEYFRDRQTNREKKSQEPAYKKKGQLDDNTKNNELYDLKSFLMASFLPSLVVALFWTRLTFFLEKLQKLK